MRIFLTESIEVILVGQYGQIGNRKGNKFYANPTAGLQWKIFDKLLDLDFAEDICNSQMVGDELACNQASPAKMHINNTIRENPHE